MEKRYQIYRTEAEITVEELLSDYYDGDYFEGLCRKCHNYGNVWSCPPYNFSKRGFLERFEKLRVIGTRIVLDRELREETITKEGIAGVTEEMMSVVKAETDSWLLALEREEPGSRMLSSGGCRLCTRCARTAGMPCRQKGKMRCSLESLGCDVEKLSREKLGIELLWVTDRLPEYFVLVNGLLTGYLKR